MNYVIRSFDPNTGSVVVDFENVGRYNIDLPIENGKYPEGDALDTYIMHHAPTWVIERANQLKAGVENAAYIASLVVSEPQVTPTEAQTPDIDPNAKMWAQAEFERKLGAALVKFGVLQSNPVDIPVSEG